MNLSYLKLQDFRNYHKKSFEFSKNTTLLVGPNAAGKTNVLEAIYLLATGRSFRATREEQMILYGRDIGRVKAEIDSQELEIILTRRQAQLELGRKTKRYLINGVAKRRMDFVGSLRCVLFRPEDIELVLGSPSQRRAYLDNVLEQARREYRRSSLAYQKGLRQRNRLLERIREGEAEAKQLLFWNEILIRNGELVSQERESYLNFINQRLKKRGLDLRLEYDRSVISPARLAQYAEAEIGAGLTLVGPHRDDFLFIVQRKGKAEKNLAIYGSRGEQRMAILAVKLAEREFVEADQPLLLLDDIFSELDHENRDEVLKLLPHQQTIVTTTDEHSVPTRYKKNVAILRL